MLDFFVHALSQAEAAEMAAAELRTRHGREAEKRCDEQMRQLASDDPAREVLRNARRVLRWVR
jgi:hypothetical protein